MDNFLDKMYEFFGMVIITLGLTAFFVYNTMSFKDISFEKVITDVHTWVHAIFVMVLQALVVSVSSGQGLRKGLGCSEFLDANEDNTDIMNDINNDPDSFWDYTDKINAHNKKMAERNIRRNKYQNRPDSELNWFQKRKIRKARYNSYDVSKFATPLYFKRSRGGVTGFDASYDLDKNKLWATLKIVIMGVTSTLMTYNMSFLVENLGNAFFQLMVLIATLSMSYFFYYFRPYTHLRVIIPQRVKLRKDFYDGFKESGHKFIPEEPTVDLDYEPQEIELHIRKEKED